MSNITTALVIGGGVVGPVAAMALRTAPRLPARWPGC